MSTGSDLDKPGLAEGPQTTGPVGLQTLLDLLVGVYQEFYSSPFAREKYVSGFLQWGECFPLFLGFCVCMYVFFYVLKPLNSAWILQLHFVIPDNSTFIQTTCWQKSFMLRLTIHVNHCLV